MSTKKLVKKIMSIVVAVVVVSSLTSFAQVENVKADDEQTVSPFITVSAITNAFYSYGWGYKTTVAVSVDDPQTPQNPDCSASVYAEWGDADNGGCLAKAGDIITVVGNGVSMTYTVPMLDVTKIDVANNIIVGIADPNKQISLQLDVLWPAPDLTTMSDENGKWEFDLSTLSPPVDLKLGVWGKVYLADEAGNYTWDQIDIPIPHIYVFLNTSTIYGYEFR